MATILGKISLALAAMLLTLLALEIGVPFLIPVTDNLDYDHLPGVGLRLAPAQDGRFIREGIDARFHTNAAGFNNRNEYVNARKAGRRRVAIVGDSFVEALQVDQEDAFFQVLERDLETRGIDAEVYSFGVSGSGTAQAYHMIGEYVLVYEPDFVAYLFIPNDVLDSARCAGGSRWTQQYRIGTDGALEPVAFERYQLSSAKRLLRRSSLFRYFFYQRRLLERLQAGADTSGVTRVDSGESPCEAEAWQIVEDLLQRMDEALREADVPWVLLWQGDADPAFHAEKRKKLKRIVQRHNLPYLDLSVALRADFEVLGKPHRIPYDGHWNAEGHRVVGRALAEFLAPRWK
jgi:lysophospholipase L1-like esterase